MYNTEGFAIFVGCAYLLTSGSTLHSFHLQEAWVASQAEELKKFSVGYQAMTGNKKVKSMKSKL